MMTGGMTVELNAPEVASMLLLHVHVYVK